MWQCTCNKGKFKKGAHHPHKKFYPTQIDEQERCIYCLYYAVKFNNTHSTLYGMINQECKNKGHLEEYKTDGLTTPLINKDGSLPY
jgi:hypothetical protein